MLNQMCTHMYCVFFFFFHIHDFLFILFLRLRYIPPLGLYIVKTLSNNSFQQLSFFDLMDIHYDILADIKFLLLFFLPYSWSNATLCLLKKLKKAKHVEKVVSTLVSINYPICFVKVFFFLCLFFKRLLNKRSFYSTFSTSFTPAPLKVPGPVPGPNVPSLYKCTFWDVVLLIFPLFHFSILLM